MTKRIFMEKNEKEALVKELYEKYPYPSRKVNSRKDLEKYANWVGAIFNNDKNFWDGKKVLELGCGTGELAVSLSNAGAKVKAIDFSSSSIKKARALAEKFSSKVEFSEENILEFNSEDRFDIVIALGSLHHTVDAKKGYEIGVKHLKKNGIIIIGLYNKYSRARHRAKRFILKLLCGSNIEKRIAFGEKIFGSMKNKTWSADKYGQVHESYHSINEILKWFSKEKITFIASKPKYKHPTIDEIKWFFQKGNAFFIMVGKKH